MNRRKLGYSGEGLAARYLEKNGYKVLCRNYTVRGGELDLVACDKKYIVFVEVKTRSSDNFGRAGEAVDLRKVQRMVKTAEHFLYERADDSDVLGRQPRFDVIEIYTQKGTLEHIKNIEIQ